MAALTLEQQKALALSRSRQRQAAQAPALRPGISPGADPREAVLAIGSAAIAEPVSGLTGILGGLISSLGASVIPEAKESPLDKAARFQAATQEALTFVPKSEVGTAALETVGGVVEAGIEAVRKPVAGLAGVAQLPFSGIEGAAETIRRTEEEGIGPTAGRFAEEFGAPPIVSAAIETAPLALATVAGVRFPKATPKGPQGRTTSIANPEVQVSVGRPRLDDPVDFTPQARPSAPDAQVGAFLDELEAALPDAPNPQAAVNILKQRFPAEAERLGLLSRTGPEIREALAGLKRGDPAAKTELARRITEGAPVAQPLSGVATLGAEAPAGATLAGRAATRVADETPPISAEKIVEDLAKQKPERLAQAVVPDQKIVDSAQRLGVDLNVEHYSTSTAFQDVARALKSRPGSQLLAGEVQAIRDLATRADDLVTDIGGALDKGAVSEDILGGIRTTIDDLQKQADVAYTKVREAIPAQTRVETGGIREFIQGRLDDLGGDKSLLSGVERKLLKLVEGGKDGSITYAALDRVRRDVGEGFNQRTGPFADNSQRVLREVYDNLSQTQNGVAEAFGAGEIYTLARELVAKRKGIEDQAVTLFGRDASGSLVPKIRAAAVGLPKGDVTAFNRLLDALPAARRGEVAATVLGELFAAGSRQGGQLGTGFAKTWQNLNRNKAARDTLLRELPPEAAQRFQDIGRVMDAIVRSNAKPLANPSGSAAGIIRALEDGTIATRLYDSARGVAGGVAQATPVLGTVLRLSKRGDSTNIASRVDAADAFLGSQTFKDAVSVALDGDLAKANRIAENSPQFKRWITTVPEGTARNIGTLGFMSWLASEEE